MAEPWNYDRQAVVRLNSDLNSLCTALFRKRVAEGTNDLTQQLNIPDGTPDFKSASTLPLTNKSRLYLVGHGNPESTRVGGRDATQAATLVRSLIPAGVKIQRLTLVCCYAGGNKHGEKLVGGKVVSGGEKVGVSGSFALALYVKLAACVASVSARTARTSRGEIYEGEGYKGYTRNKLGEWTHHDKGAKVVLSGLGASGTGAYNIEHTYGVDDD